MIKIYKVNTFEKFEYLLKTLHERGAKWASGHSLDNEDMVKRYWRACGDDGVCIYKRDKVVSVYNIKYFEKSIKEYGNQGEDYTIIEDVKLTKPKESETHSNNDTGEYVIFSITEDHRVKSNQSDTIEQPSHYIGEHGLEVREIEENFLVRYQDGHLAHLAGALLEYLLRAPSKGKLAEDIQKVQYLANEMAEYVEKVSQE